MDIEQTMEFIVAQHAKAEAILIGLVASQARGDKQILAMQKVVEGIKLVSDIGQRPAAADERIKQNAEQISEISEKMKETDERMKQLAESQRETDAKFKQLMDVLLKRNQNGH